MCMGGGGGGGVIRVPNYGAYNSMADQQIAAIKAAQDRSTTVLQGQLNQSTLKTQGILGQLHDLEVRMANNTEEQARRLTTLMGAPPPEKSATAPVMGRDRGLPTTKGKSSLRIDRASSGAGLNIT